MTRSKMIWVVLAAIVASVLLASSDAIGGRGSVKFGKKSRLKWDRNKWGGGDSYPGESRKSSSDRKPERRVKSPPADHTVPAVPRGAPGTPVAELPAKATTTYAGGRAYSYSAGVFFQKTPAAQSDYVIVAPPYGAVVDELPSDFRKVKNGNSTDYMVDDTTYRRIMRSDEVAYIVTRNS